MSVEIGPQWRIAKAVKIREAMGPEFRSIADSLRETFGTVKSLDWLETDTLSMGTKEPDEPIGERAWNGKRERV